jgi:hypothetical protein
MGVRALATAQSKDLQLSLQLPLPLSSFCLTKNSRHVDRSNRQSHRLLRSGEFFSIGIGITS